MRQAPTSEKQVFASESSARKSELAWLAWLQSQTGMQEGRLKERLSRL